MVRGSFIIVYFPFPICVNHCWEKCWEQWQTANAFNVNIWLMQVFFDWMNVPVSGKSEALITMWHTPTSKTNSHACVFTCWGTSWRFFGRRSQHASPWCFPSDPDTPPGASHYRQDKSDLHQKCKRTSFFKRRVFYVCRHNNKYIKCLKRLTVDWIKSFG